MLKITTWDPGRGCRILEHGEDIFHRALWYVEQGEKTFHVARGGESLYDLVYVRNQDFAEASPLYTKTVLFKELPLYPSYLRYDEEDVQKLCYDVVEPYDTVWFESVSEYSVVLAKVLLRDTDKQIRFADERVFLFLAPSDRLAIGGEPEDRKKTLVIYKDFCPSAFDSNFSRMDAMVFFHQVFLFQWLTPLPMSAVKHAELVVPNSEGIGSILLGYSRVKSVLEKRGISVSVRLSYTRYSDRMMLKYFNLPETPEDANESNTIYVLNYYSLLYAKPFRVMGELSAACLKSGFLAELKEYADAVFSGRKMLGILLRGSDYITTHMSGNSTPVSVRSAIPLIRKWMADYGFEKIFLATEDQDILDEMREAFPGRLLAVAQERYRAGSLGDRTTINEYEKKTYLGEEYDRHIEDMTVNYFYALYLLSECDSFMYSCHCAGAVLARQLRGEPFRREYCFSDGRLREAP